MQTNPLIFWPGSYKMFQVEVISFYSPFRLIVSMFKNVERNWRKYGDFVTLIKAFQILWG